MRVKDVGEGIVDLVARLRGGRTEREVCKMSVHLDENKVTRGFDEIFQSEKRAEGQEGDLEDREHSGLEGCCWTSCWKCGSVSASS